MRAEWGGGDREGGGSYPRPPQPRPKDTEWTTLAPSPRAPSPLPRAAHVGAVPQKRRRGRARVIHSRLYSYTGQQCVSLLHRGKTSQFWAQLKRHTGNTAANRTGILTTVPPPPPHTHTDIHTHQPHGDIRGLNALRNASVSETITC